ncbi:CBL-interacting protein kinase 11 [Wickerhamomyces ciferrii]|uniref:CBL-interacting protein kinase 11 n=1 Tax=Wickerhamomyces ciferrii (strain ATCC 14091 / BCRC 22168 / CBS 111 / JCM 3599 / NBRC 0793 / NRRL Y-1031 F-60-10) TaxID=1206466 RepID=K0KEW5_WICCF|nr:CBL-interacting protein kinase 11 [Wickerhamomyces ciferrii]CCH40752.1 CBL-interacting protein kinase 11 [Wickerhamomyces ciferrii]
MDNPEEWEIIEPISRNSKCSVNSVLVNGDKFISKQYFKTPLKRECLKLKKLKGLELKEVDIIRKEYNLMKKIQNSRTIDVFSLVDYGTSIYLLLEYGGDPLGTDNIQDTRRYAIQDVLIWMVQLTQGLKIMHDQGIIHGDFKPSNVLLLPNGRDIKICDFGSSIENVDDTRPIDKIPKCTPAYYSPELCEHSLNPKSMGIMGKPLDVWALGVTIYKLLFGVIPFNCSGTIFQLQYSIINDLIEIPNEVLDQNDLFISIPKNFIKILLALLDKDPNQRMTIQELEKSLEGV